MSCDQPYHVGGDNLYENKQHHIWHVVLTLSYYLWVGYMTLFIICKVIVSVICCIEAGIAAIDYIANIYP